MDRVRLTETQSAILMALLEKRARLEREINEQIDELAEMVKLAHKAPENWRLTGNPQTGFFLEPQEETDDEPTA